MHTLMRTARGLALGLAASAGLATAAHAQSFENLTWAEFDRAPAKWSGKRVRLHATFVSKAAEVKTEAWDGRYFANNGITFEKHHRFTVMFAEQTREGLFPVIVRNAAGERLWETVKDTAAETRVTLWGRLRRLGDAGYRGNVYVPTVLEVARVETGWVKDLDEYLVDLEDSKQREETVALMVRGGEASLPKLQAAAESKRLGDTVRCGVLEAIGRIGKAAHAQRLAAQLRTEVAPRVRAAVLWTMCRLDHDLAIGELRKLIDAPASEAWAADASVELLLEDIATVAELTDVFGRKWDAHRPRLLAAATAAGDEARKEQRWPRADACYTAALALDPASGPLFLARGRVREARATADPALAEGAAADLTRALELGVEDPDLWFAHAKACAAAGRTDEARTWVERVLAKRPDDRDARVLRAEVTGGSLLMIDTRVARMNGVSIRVPPTWEDAPADCNPARGTLLSVFGLGPKSVKDDTRTWVGILVIGKPPGVPMPAGVPTTLPADPEGTVRSWLTQRGHTVLETGRTTVAKSQGTAWAVTTHEMGGLMVKRLIGFVFTGTALYECNYRSDAAQFDELRPAFLESLQSLAHGLDG